MKPDDATDSTLTAQVSGGDASQNYREHMGPFAGEITLTKREARLQTFLLVYGGLGFTATLVIYNTTGRWWPMAAYLVVYLVLGAVFAVHLARTRQRLMRSLLQSLNGRRPRQQK